MKNTRDIKRIIDFLIVDLVKQIGEEGLKRYFEIDRTKDCIISKVDDKECLNIRVSISDQDTVVSYFSGNYENYSELPFENLDERAIADYLYAIVMTIVRQGAVRTDKYVGDKLVSSSLKVGDVDATTAVKGFRLFGKRKEKKILYKPYDNLESDA